MKIRRRGTGPEKVQLEMTPMIDVVFQLLAFFICTFRVVQSEGDFEIRIPAAPAETKDLTKRNPDTLRIRMEAGENGDLTSLTLNNEAIGGGGTSPFVALHEHVRNKYINDQGGPSKELETAEAIFECDYDLKYVNVIQALDAIRGHKTGSGDDAKTIQLIEKINFTPAVEKKK